MIRSDYDRSPWLSATQWREPEGCWRGRPRVAWWSRRSPRCNSARRWRGRRSRRSEPAGPCGCRWWPRRAGVTIAFVGPLAVALGGSRRRIDFVWVARAAAGILALTQGGAHRLDGLGVAFALLAGALWGAYILLNARVGRAFEGGTGLALSMCVASVAGLPAGVIEGGTHLLEP